MRSSLMRRVVEGSTRGVALLGGSVAAALVLLTAAEVVSRYFLNKPSDWTMEISEYLLVFVALAGMAYGIQTAGHVSVDIVYNRYPLIGKRIVNVVAAVLTLAFWALFTWIALRQGLAYLARNTRSESILAIPLWYPMLALVIGGVLACLQTLVLIADKVSALRRGGSGTTTSKAQT